MKGMQEHPVPRQITTFEFKLIGELTIKQFGYLAMGSVLAVIVFFLIPNFMFLNYLGAAIPALIGIGFAFVPINERPMDVWLKNLFKRLVSPTQYYYRKHNQPPKILLGITLPPREVLLEHVKAQQKLNEYLSKKPKGTFKETGEEIEDGMEKKKQKLQSLMESSRMAAPVTPAPSAPPASDAGRPAPDFTPVAGPAPQPANPVKDTDILNLNGAVFTATGVPLKGMLVYVKKDGATIRLFKTNDQGAFQNNLPLPRSDYILEVEDPQKKYQFARMKIEDDKRDLSVFAQ